MVRRTGSDHGDDDRRLFLAGSSRQDNGHNDRRGRVSRRGLQNKPSQVKPHNPQTVQAESEYDYQSQTIVKERLDKRFHKGVGGISGIGQSIFSYREWSDKSGLPIYFSVLFHGVS